MSVAEYPAIEGGSEVSRLRTLYWLLAALSQANALEEVYAAALTSLLNATAADRAAILIFDGDGIIRFKASRGLSLAYQDAVTGHSPWPRGTRGATPVVVRDALRDESLSAYRSILEREGIRSLAFIPLELDGGVFGKFMLYYSEPHDCAGEEMEIARAIAAHVALAADRKRAELARMSGEQRLSRILDNSPAMIFLKDLQGRFLLVNRRYEEVFHTTSDKLLGTTVADRFEPAVAEALQSNDRAVLAAGKAMTFEERVPQEDGIHTFLSVKFPLHGSDGNVSGLCGIATDITERKRLEAASQYLAAIVESSEDAIISKDLNGTITSWNKAAERMFGYPAQAVIGKPVSILAAPGHLNEMPAILARIREGERVAHYETRRRTNDGEILDVALTVSPVRDSSGRIVGASKIVRDITDRKRQEAERALLLAREREARRTAELLNQIGPRLAAQLDPRKLVQEVTDIATALLAAGFGAFVQSAGGVDSTLYALSGASAEVLEYFQKPCNDDLFAPTFRGERTIRSEDLTSDVRYRGISLRHATPDGPLPVRSYLAVPVVAHSGEVLGGLFFCHGAPGRFTETHEAIIRGIAAQTAIAMDNARLFEQARWARTELTRSNEELRRANHDLEVFVYSASHDLQEPLRTIAISAQLIERGWGSRLEGDDATFLRGIIAAATRMNVLIQDLLTYANATRFGEGAPPIVDSRSVLAEVIENLRASIQETGATVTTGDLPVAAIHPGRLAQLFQNLIGNAIKYHTKEAPHVHVSGNERDGWCTFSVTDNGIGVERQYWEKIFGLFNRLHGKHQYQGSGIGLAICQRIVEQYGGRIWLDRSEPGQGSTFCFAVPARLGPG